MEEKDTYRNIEIAERAVHDIEYRMSEEFGVWLQDEQHRTLFRDFLLYREAMMNLYGTKKPRIKKALRRVVSKADWRRMRARHRRMLRLWISTAALFVLLFSVGIYMSFRVEKQNEMNTVTVLPSVNLGGCVTLSVNDGKAVTVSDSCLSYRRKNTDKAALHTLSVPRGQTFRLELEDGTVVWLNAESKISYPNRFMEKERLVTVEGEAYFRVAKDALHPFVVRTGTLEMRTFGTEFNVRAYEGEDLHVTLIRGSVRVSEIIGKRKRTLTPGQDLAIDAESGYARVNTVDVREYTAWKDNLFCFRNKELLDIMKEMGRWYNVEIVFSNRKSMSYHFNFWADKTIPLNDALLMLNKVGKVKAEIVNGRLIIH